MLKMMCDYKVLWPQIRQDMCLAIAYALSMTTDRSSTVLWRRGNSPRYPRAATRHTQALDHDSRVMSARKQMRASAHSPAT